MSSSYIASTNYSEKNNSGSKFFSPVSPTLKTIKLTSKNIINNLIQKEENQNQSNNTENQSSRPIPSPSVTQINWLQLKQPFLDRGVPHLMYDQAHLESAERLWSRNFSLFSRLPINPKLAVAATNLFTPMAIDAALRNDHPTQWEIMDQELQVTSYIASTTLFTFDIGNLGQTLQFKPIELLGKKLSNPYNEGIQPKLKIGQPNDKYEQEADATADQVMRVQSNGGPMAGSDLEEETLAPKIQTKCAACADQEKISTKPLIQKMDTMEEEGDMINSKRIQRMGDQEDEIHTKPMMMRKESGGGVATQTLASKLSSTKGGGNPLPDATNQSMSQAFGTDFSQVRVHNNSNAQQMNQGIQARAFTHGSDIYFNKGEYRPESSDGQRLLAHELTHVVQQGGGKENIHPYRNPDEFNFGQGGKVGQFEEDTFADQQTQPWIEKIDITFNSKHVDGGGHEFWKGTLTATYFPNGHEPGTQFNIPISGGGKDLGWSDKGNFTVHRIEGIGYNSGTFSGNFDPNDREGPRNRYSKGPNRSANMHLAVFYNRGEAMHIGPLDTSSHGCIHVESWAAMRLINFHSVRGRTKVNVKYTK